MEEIARLHLADQEAIVLQLLHDTKRVVLLGRLLDEVEVLLAVAGEGRRISVAIVGVLEWQKRAFSLGLLLPNLLPGCNGLLGSSILIRVLESDVYIVPW